MKLLEEINISGVFENIKRQCNIIISLLIFLYAVISLVRYNTITQDALYLESPDGDLYISIARNFLNNGHFIQNSREYEVNMIVPFGLPLFYTILLFIFNNIYPIVVIQYIIYGVSVVLISQAARKLSGTYLACIMVPSIFVYLRNFIKQPNPSYLLTETYTIFFLSLFLYLLVSKEYTEKRIILLYITAFFGYCFRPVIGIVILVPVILAFVDVIKSIKLKTRQHKHKIASYALAIGFSAIILLINGSINYKETGQFVLIENYGGIAAYQANNINTQTIEYNSGLINEFSDDYFMEIYEDPELDMNEKNEFLNNRTREFVFSNLGFVLNNTRIKYIQLYHMPEHGFNIILLYICIVMLFLLKKEYRKFCILFALSFGGATIIPAFGLYIMRYGVSCVPFYSLIYGGAVSAFISMLVQYIRKVVKF